MSYLALYRKYRPDSFDDVVGQDKVVKVIRNAIVNDKISHAYLFSGPRGTGKTTTAKIIAKMVNCENLIDGHPCNCCNSCINILKSNDIVEIDAASNNGVDEIRELRDKVNLVPSACKYKVYIIDEVHMLTTQAFNALLKTLEEPPSHVIFILATTEFYKIPLTVTSRCQKFQFTKIDDVDIVKRLTVICDIENIKINKDALFEIARLSDGGLRDAINFLDQLTAYQSDVISIDDVYKISGSVSYDELFKLLVDIKECNNKEIIEFIENIDKNGKNLSKFIEEFIIFLKDVLIYNKTSNLSNIDVKNNYIKNLSNELKDDFIFYFINQLNELIIKLKTASYPAILIIVELLKVSSYFFKVDYVDNNNLNNGFKVDDNENINETNNDLDNKNNLVNLMNDDIVKIRINNSLAGAKKEFLINIKNKWNEISNYLIDEKYGSIVGLLTDVYPIVASDNYLMLECKYDSQVSRINSFDIEISNFLEELLGFSYKIVAISSERWKIVKNKYVSDIKEGKKYSLISEEKDKYVNKKDDSLNKLVELLGEDLIEYR